MLMRLALALSLLALSPVEGLAGQDPAPKWVEIPADELEDRIRGGLLGQVFGNLNGLPHEFKYIEEPGKVETYVPSLPHGAYTDDDTDIEWVYLVEMERSDKTLVPAPRIAELWRENLNSRIWCANLYARTLLDIGIEPPLTGRHALNPWGVFNISAQFVSESFGHIAPAMPRTASRIGIHYTRVAVDGEPIQTTQFFATMIATAFVERDALRIVEAGLRALDPASDVHGVVGDVIRWWRETPDDWRATRLKIKQKYTRHGGTMRDRNGYELNTAAIVGSLLHAGTGDLAEVLRLAFNFGWDSDCNAATCGAIVGVILGKKAMDAKGWQIGDAYRNTCRDRMPKDETLTRYGDRLISAARRVILEQGGEEVERGGRKLFRIRAEEPGNVEPLPKPLDRREELRAKLLPEIEAGLKGGETDRARAAYYALALGESARLAKERPEDWAKAVASLKMFSLILREIYNAPRPSGDAIQAAARAAGIEKP